MSCKGIDEQMLFTKKDKEILLKLIKENIKDQDNKRINELKDKINYFHK
jgi:hypothetical protein